MRVRLAVAAAAAVTLAVVAAACSGGHHGGPAISVRVVDAHDLPIANATVVSSLGEKILGVAVAGADGVAKVPAADGAVYTAHVHDTGGRFTSVTVAGLTPADASLTIPLLASFAGGGDATPSEIDVSAPAGVAAASMASGDQCQNLETIGTPNTLSVEPWCVQTDGTISIFAIGLDTNLTPVGYGATIDQPLGATIPVAVDASTGETVTVAAAGVDTSDLFSWSVSAEPMRKGQAIANGIASDRALAVSAPMHGTTFATSIIAALAISGPLGDQSVVHAGPPAASWSLSGAELPAPPDALTVDTAFTGGRAGGAWDPPAATTASFVLVRILWDDHLSNPHDWYLYEPASSATGGRATVRMPPLPASLSTFRAEPGNVADTFRVTYFSADTVADLTHLEQLALPPPDSFTMTTAAAEQPL